MSSGELTRFNPLDVSDPEDQPAHIPEHATEAAPAHRGTSALGLVLENVRPQRALPRRWRSGLVPRS
jgi:hypothetical protein